MDDIEQAVRDRLFQEINKLKSLVGRAEACIANSEYILCAKAIQSAGVAFSKFEHEIFSVADKDRG